MVIGHITYRWRDIFAYIDWKSPFSPTVFCLSTPSGRTPSNINVIYTSLKSLFIGLQFCRWQYGFIFILHSLYALEWCGGCFVASKIYEIPRKFELIALQGHPKWCESKAHMQVPISQ